MLDSIRATKGVAPEAVPDLVALPRPVLETAARQGLIFPFDENPAIQEDTDWYDFAQQLARVDNLHYGLPFACDALVLLYRTRAITDPPRDWTSTQELALPLLFPLGSADSLFTFTLYQAAGGKVQDADGQPFITPATLATVYDFYQTAQTSGVFSSELEKYLSEEDAFLAYLNGDGDMTIAWVSAFWTRAGEGTASGALPTPRWGSVCPP
ncbi:MAG: extracellular solute-binding protein [Anaerolineae bacterium]|nr:extracellular solute-binding protein [Anaerolineae bacterium]